MDDRCNSASSGLEVQIDGHAQTSPLRSQHKQFIPSPMPSLSPSITRSWERANVAERIFAYDTARRCVEDGLSLRGKDLQHARYFAYADFQVLKDALPASDEGTVSTSVTSTCSLEEMSEEPLETSAAALQIPDMEMKRKSSLWKKIRKKLSSENIPSASNSPSKSSPTKIAAMHGSPEESSKRPYVGRINDDASSPFRDSMCISKAFAVLLATAPSKGDVIHWVWLTRAFMNKCSISDATPMLKYLASIVKCIAPEEQWLRLLAVELRPALNRMRDNQLSAGNQALTRTVADRAMQVCHEAIRDFRTCKTSKLENAAILSSAMQLQMLVTKCASNENCQDMAAIFEEQLNAAAQRRFHCLTNLSSDDAGLSSPTAGPKDIAERSILSTSAVCEQLVQDITDDEQCYQAHLPPGCKVRLAEISCRTYGSLLKLELSRLMGHPINADRNFFELFNVVHSLQNQVLQWAPATLGPKKCFCDQDSKPIFLHSLEGWMRIVRTKLMQWSMRLLKEEVWQHPMTTSAGSKCSPSLVELFRALCSVTEENATVSGACIMYSGLMERTLAKVVLVHVAGLESLCQRELPSRSGRNLTGQLRSLGSRGPRESTPQEFQASTTLCMLLNDMREIRSKQTELGALLRSCVPAQWWGAVIDGGSSATRLGDRFKACQVEIERRYSLVLHHVAKKIILVWRPLLTDLLSSSERADKDECTVDSQLASVMRSELGRLSGLLDVRVQKRVARELWNELAGVLEEDLLACQDSDGNSKYHSLGNIAPRVQHIDFILKDLSQIMLSSKAAGLKASDAPDKVIKLQKMLALFLKEDEGLSLESM